MNAKNTENHQTCPQENILETNHPDWVVKSARGNGKQSCLERIGVAWNREDGGIGIRLSGTQIIEDTLYLYPNDMSQ